jgi:hypothetical protein
MTAKEKFIELFDKYITRAGSEDLRIWLLASDFFTAPASTKYHNDHEGGLCEHSINVFDQMVRLLRAYPEIKTNGETVAIISLLHDMCKIDCYVKELKSRKTGEIKPDGKPVWEDYYGYSWDEKFPYGNHGAKSVYLIERFIRLTDTEAIAIQCHMGNEDGKYGVSESYRQYPLAWLLHVADEAASYLDEKEE